MFTRDDAARLRTALPPLAFAATDTTGPLLQRYRAHYGLEVGNRQSAASHHVGVFASDDFELVCHYFSLCSAAERGTMFVVHGYFDHTGIYRHLIHHCLDGGYGVVIPDLPGHGLSSGPAADIDSFDRYSTALRRCLEAAEGQQVARPWYLIGQSAGGAVIMDAMLSGVLSERFPIEKILLLAPLLRPRYWIWNRILFGLTHRLADSIARHHVTNSHDGNFLKFVRDADALQSRRLPMGWVRALIAYQERFARAAAVHRTVHVIQGSDDHVVDWRYNLVRIKRKFPGAQIEMIAGARHQLVNESVDYRRELFDAMDRIVEAGPDRQ